MKARGRAVLLPGEDDVIALLKALGRVGERNAAEERVMPAYFRGAAALSGLSRANG